MITTFRLSTILFFLLLTFSRVYAGETGVISGKVIDAKTGESLPGAIVLLDSLKRGAVTDLNGNFTIANVIAGKHKLSCHYVSYAPKVFNEVFVKPGNVAEITFTLESADKELKMVEVTATISKESSIGLLLQQKNSVTFSDGISGESIRKTPDKSTGDVLKRISGASIQDNKFAIIRGLNDRYNAALINGSPLPSSEPDRKAFAFDIFPANMLENLVIIKTASPDLPSEFAGGIIQITTKNIPEKNFQSVSISSGYNTFTTGKNQLYYKGGSLDWLGIDDGTRRMPSTIPAKDNFPLNIDQQASLAKNTQIDWATYNKKFAPNLSLQYTFGHSLTIHQKPLGILVAASYNKSSNYTETIRKGYSGNTNGEQSQLEFNYLDKSYSENVLAGLLGNLSYKINNNNTISFKNLYSINSEDKVVVRNGMRDPVSENPTLTHSTAAGFTGNKIYTGQIIGEHLLAASKIRIDWMGAYSNIQRDIPNLRRMIYSKQTHINDPSNPNPTDTTYVANISYNNVGSDYGGGIFYSHNSENIVSGKGDVSYTFKSSENAKHDFKAGIYIQNRARVFDARQLGYTKYGKLGGNVSFRDSLLMLDDNHIFLPGNMGLIEGEKNGQPGIGGFKLTDGTKYSDSYTASSGLQAAYLMADDKINKLRIVWGARIENFTQRLNALKADNTALSLATSKFDVLPSANFIYSLKENQNVRFSASQTLNRPEYRELAPFAFYDFNTQFVITGNDQLKRAKITNFDLRYEIYPGRGQLFSVSTFYKHFQNPIEQVSRADVTKEISFLNLDKARNFGVELEFRVLLGALLHMDSSIILKNLTAFSNIALISSNVNVSNVVGYSSASRPLQGQSPFVFNAGLQYLSEKGLMASLSLNAFGQRIAIVGNVNDPDIWEKGRSLIDLQIGQMFMDKKLEIKLNVQNLLGQKQVYYQNHETITKQGLYNSSTTYNQATDDLVWSTKFGRIISLGASYKF